MPQAPSSTPPFLNCRILLTIPQTPRFEPSSVLPQFRSTVKVELSISIHVCVSFGQQSFQKLRFIISALIQLSTRLNVEVPLFLFSNLTAPPKELKTLQKFTTPLVPSQAPILKSPPALKVESVTVRAPVDPVLSDTKTWQLTHTTLQVTVMKPSLL